MLPDPAQQLIYFVENPADRKTYPYTGARKKTDSAPRFSQQAKAEVENVTSDTVTVRFDQAKADVCVYGYRLLLSAADAPKKTLQKKEIYSEYYFEPMPETLCCTFEDLQPDTAYQVLVYPLNVWRKAGAPLNVSFKTKA